MTFVCSTGARISLVLAAMCFSCAAMSQDFDTVLSVADSAGSAADQSWSVSIQVLVAMTALAFLPTLLLAATSFTRIVIVLAVLRQALGMPQTPPNQVLMGLALFLSLFIMAPVMQRIYDEGMQPYMEGELQLTEAVGEAALPMREFMLGQTRETDLALFAGLAEEDAWSGPAAVPFAVLLPAFLTSELKTAFQIGFLTFIPFLIIDLVVASVLMSMGMMMLSPMLVSLPFKIMLFVLVDGWALIVGTLASSFAT
jgi:flagellar biosynthetic protein FliP